MKQKAHGPNGHTADSAAGDKEDVVAELVIAYDEALRTGTVLPDESTTVETLDPKLRERLSSAKDCLRLIERVRQFRRHEAQALLTDAVASFRQESAYTSSGTIHRIGRFEIIRELGRGSHGIVFLARDPALCRDIALKVPRPEAILTPQLRSRFLREGKAAARLNHPNILPVHEAGEAGPICYLVQSYCSGPSLAAWLAQEKDPVPCDLAARIVAELADGVDHAHKQGILHRDIKPSNVMLELRAACGGAPPFTPKLADFGLAKALDDDPNATATLGAIGTATYMPPEQARGDLSLVGPRSDVYSLGALLYELLTRRPPIAGVNQLETLRLIASEDPRPLRELRGDVPRELEAICHKCLEKSPDSRYRTAAELAADLRRFLAGQSVAASPQGRWRRTLRSLRRQPRSILIGALTIVMLAAGLLLCMLLIWSNRTEKITGRMEPPPDPAAEYLNGIGPVSQGYFDAVAKRGDVTSAVTALGAFLERHLPQPGQTDYRGFEWHYLWRLCHPDKVAQPFPKLFDLVGHKGEVYFVTFSPDGKRIATAGQDHTGRIWDAATGKLLTTLTGHTYDVNWIAFAPESLGRHVLTASDDQSVRVWNLDSGKMERVVSSGDSRMIAAEAASLLEREGERSTRRSVIVAGDHRGRLLIWDWITGRQLRSIQAHGSRVEALAPYPGRAWWISASLDHSAKEWDSDTWTPVRTHVADGGISAAACNSDASLVAFANARSLREYAANAPKDEAGHSTVGLITIDELPTGKRWLTLTGTNSRPFDCVRFCPGQNALVATGRDRYADGTEGHILLCDIPTQRSWKPVGAQPDCWCAAFSTDGTRMATAGNDGVVRVWDSSLLPTGVRLNASNGALEMATRTVTFSPDGRTVLATHMAWPDRPYGGPSFDLWDVSGKRPARIYAEPSGSNISGSHAGCFSPDGALLAVDTSKKTGLQIDSHIRLLDAKSLREVSRLTGYADGARRILFSPDGNCIIAVTGHETGVESWQNTGLYVWNRAHPAAPEFRSTSGAHDFMATALSPDGRVLATNRQQVELWDFPSLRLIRSLPIALGAEGVVRFSPNGHILAVGGEEGTVHLWDLQDSRDLAALRPDGHAVFSLTFSPDGTRLAAGHGGTPRIDVWDVPSQKRVAQLSMPTDYVSVTDLTLSPDMRTLAAVGDSSLDAGAAFLFPLEAVSGVAEESAPAKPRARGPAQ